MTRKAPQSPLPNVQTYPLVRAPTDRSVTPHAAPLNAAHTMLAPIYPPKNTLNAARSEQDRSFAKHQR